MKYLTPVRIGAWLGLLVLLVLWLLLWNKHSLVQAQTETILLLREKAILLELKSNAQEDLLARVDKECRTSVRVGKTCVELFNDTIGGLGLLDSQKAQRVAAGSDSLRGKEGGIGPVGSVSTGTISTRRTSRPQIPRQP